MAGSRVATASPLATRNTQRDLDYEALAGRPRGPQGRGIPAVAEVVQGYPLHDGPVKSWLSSGPEWWRLEYLPAGPFLGASDYLGAALCTHQALIKTQHWLKRNIA